MKKISADSDIVEELKSLAVKIKVGDNKEIWIVKEFNIGLNVKGSEDKSKATRFYLNFVRSKKVEGLDFINSKNSLEVEPLLKFLEWAGDWLKKNQNNKLKFDQFAGNNIYNQLDTWVNKNETKSSDHLPDVDANNNDDLPF